MYQGPGHLRSVIIAICLQGWLRFFAIDHEHLVIIEVGGSANRHLLVHVSICIDFGGSWHDLGATV